ncbi:galactose/methyl galactoside import ATP-binding protein MglA [Amycolatopsis deserti]|uniref:Galactose/methyl galactoside import ATP-binding protein MglA n=1 Tax=Amycolatopsis deserti TaxID=185696 RepID=A0ABQ3JHC6_9PSEU|nr:sugar ABC transporter ATP-binding protein [Amycolatopsis deserti]GHF17437.1 galactose/methyl galactoside import ATP-binding protein MglA [Amycolatopsis deserti]
MVASVDDPAEAVSRAGAARGAPVRLAVRGLVKNYPGVRALDEVDFDLAAGEVRALLGKNGAGKSTLVKILSGALRPDAGRVELDGRAVQLAGPAEARAAGIATVHQELSLVPELTVAENLLLGRWREAGARGPFINSAAMAAYAERHLATLGVAIDPKAKVGALSVAQQQMVEIARALSYGGKVLILDEPTSSLPAVEVAALLDLVRRLATDGLSVVYVSHRMDEIPQVADSVTVLRDGRHVATRPISEANTARIVDMMTGGAIHAHRPRTTASGGRTVLSVAGLSTADRVRDVSFELREGEVVGIAGLLGSGRTELLRCLSGLTAPTAGSIRLDGRPFTPRGPRQAIRAGVGLAPEDRKGEGLALGMSVSANLVMSCLPAVRSRGLLSGRRERRLATGSCTRLSVKTPSLSTAVGTLSGGNQQKVVLGKLLNAGTRVLLLDEPTRGVDVEAKDQIYQLIRDLAAAGTSVLMVSSELEELFEVCDRLLVLRDGQVVAQPKVADTAVPSVMALAMGGQQ